jgi:hypothetical protein
VIPNDLPQHDAMIIWDTPLLHAINSTAISGGTSDVCEPGKGERLGVINRQTILSGAKLSITGGRIISRVSALRRPIAVENPAA